MLPNALIVGPQRAGTTWVYRYLGLREDVVCPTRVKETFFFDRHYEKGKEWYAAFFDPDRRASRVLEVAPTYFHAAAVPHRVLDTLGRIPIIVTLRNPVERMRSLYLHLLRYGEAGNATFGEALTQLPVLLDSSRYATHLRAWQELFGPAGVHVLFYDDLNADPEGYVGALCSFLGLPYREIPPEAREPVNRTTVAPSPGLSRLATKGATALRKTGLYGVVRFGKRLGLKRMLMGRDGNARPEVDLTDLSAHAEILSREIEELEAMVDRGLPAWRRDLEVIS